MVLGVVGSDGKVRLPIFILQGVTVTMDVYLGLLRDKVIPWYRTTTSWVSSPSSRTPPAHGAVRKHRSSSARM